MKFAILGDIHANLEALTAVLEDAASVRATHYACTGDLVGYHTNPRECLEMIRELGCPVVKGNHDEEAVSDEVIIGMNPVARLSMEWTRSQLAAGQKAWLRSRGMVQNVHDFTLVHATLDSPASWAYVLNRFDAACSFSCQLTQVCFYGHTHQARVYVKTGGAIQRETIGSSPIPVVPGRKYFINTGSVGLPRDGDWRASYALYDTERREVSIRRVPFDYERLAAKTRNGPLAGHAGHLLRTMTP